MFGPAIYSNVNEKLFTRLNVCVALPQSMSYKQQISLNKTHNFNIGHAHYIIMHVSSLFLNRLLMT